MTHPRHLLDPVVHSPARFSIMAALMAADKVEFRFIRDLVEISDSALSQHVTTLDEAGYVTVTKGQVGRRPRTWLSVTPAGRTAFGHHLAVLNQIADLPADPHRTTGPHAPDGTGETQDGSAAAQ